MDTMSILRRAATGASSLTNIPAGGRVSLLDGFLTSVLRDTKRVSMRKPIEEIDILWITAGLGCDGDTIAMTAATQPSIEDLVMGNLPGIPKVNFHNPVLAYEVGEDFMKFFYDAAAGQIEPFILVIEGSIPNEENKVEGYWTGFGTDKSTGQPITICEWIDRLAPKAWAVVAAGTCASYGGIHAMEGNPRARWVFAITSAGRGNRRLTSLSLTSQVVQFSPITSWKRSFTCCGMRPAAAR